MSDVNVQQLVKAPVNDVWAAIAGFGSLALWCTSVSTCQLSEGGLLRYLQTRDGASIVERLLHFSDKDRSYRYTIISAPFQLEAYEARLSATASGPEATLVTWACDLRASPEVSGELQQAFEQLFRAGLQDLSDALERARKS